MTHGASVNTGQEQRFSVLGYILGFLLLKETP